MVQIQDIHKGRGESNNSHVLVLLLLTTIHLQANDYKDEFVNGSRTRPQSIAAARITMTDNIKFHGESADNDTLNVHNDEAVHRVIVYTAE